MNEYDEYRILAGASQLLVLSPEVPSALEVENMVERAQRIANTGTRKTVRPLQLAGVAAVLVAAVALAFSMTPGTAAFARDEALAALLPPAGKVLEFSTEIWSSNAEVPVLTETTWIDAGTDAWRTETRSAAGEVIGAKVANGDTALWTEESADVLVEESIAPTPESGFPVWLITLRDLIATPDDRVDISRTTIDGTDVWRLKNDRVYDDLAPFEAVIAADGYAPMRVTIGGQGTQGDKKATWTITQWKSVSPDSLEPGFFSFDQVKRLKPDGTPIQKNQ